MCVYIMDVYIHYAIFLYPYNINEKRRKEKHKNFENYT